MPALIDDRDMDPAISQLAGQGLLADGQGVVGRMGQGHDGLDLVVRDEPSHRPGLLPGAPVDLPRLDHRELVGEDVVVAVPPDLLGRPDIPERRATRGESTCVG